MMFLNNMVLIFGYNYSEMNGGNTFNRSEWGGGEATGNLKRV